MLEERIEACDLMQSDVVSLGPNTTITQAVEEFMEHGISGIVVVDEYECPVGVFSKTDLTRFDRYHGGGKDLLDTSELDDSFEDRHGKNTEKSSMNEPIVNWMTPSVVTVVEHTDIFECCRIMTENKVHRVFVEALDDSIMGVVSGSDIIKALAGKSLHP